MWKIGGNHDKPDATVYSTMEGKNSLNTVSLISEEVEVVM